MHQYDALISSPVGGISLSLNEERLSSLDFTYSPVEQEYFKSDVASLIASQIQRYFKNPYQQFDLELQIVGTDFHQRVWKLLRDIPPGEVRTYGELAKQLNSSARAVGNACRRNPIPLIIPCHRVVAKNGIGGFAGHTEGSTIALKHWLLAFESGKK